MGDPTRGASRSRGRQRYRGNALEYLERWGCRPLDAAAVFIAAEQLGGTAAVILQGDSALQVGEWLVAAPVVGEAEGQACKLLLVDLEPQVVRLARATTQAPMILALNRKSSNWIPGPMLLRSPAVGLAK